MSISSMNMGLGMGSILTAAAALPYRSFSVGDRIFRGGRLIGIGIGRDQNQGPEVEDSGVYELIIIAMGCVLPDGMVITAYALERIRRRW